MVSRTGSGGQPAAFARQRDRLSALRSSRIVHALVAHEHRTAAGAFALFVFAYLWPVLVGGKVLAPLAELYGVAPWTSVTPPNIRHYINQNFTDVPFSYYPWDVLARQLIHAGTFPAWNPRAFAGTPFFANPEVAWLSPFSLPLWILPLNYGLGVAAALKLWVAGFGAYLLARELKLGFWPGMLAGISFMLCAFLLVWLSYGVFPSVAALLPWTILLVERIVKRGRSVDGLALAGVVALVLTGGHPGTQVHVLAAGVLYALVRAVLRGGVARRERLRRLGLVAVALGVGVCVAAVVLLPADRAAAGTAGALARRGGSPGFLGSNLPFGVLRTALFPDWWGRPSELVAGPASFNERTFYAGAVALVLAALALISPGGWRRKTPFVLLGVLGAAVALRAPVLHTIVIHLPAFDRIQNQRMMLWFQFGVAILAAFGLEAVLAAPRRRRVWVVVGAALLAAVVALLSVHISGSAARDALHYFTHRGATATGAVLALATIGWWVVFVVALGVALLLARRLPRRRALIGGVVVLIAALDMLHFAHGYQPMGPPSIVIPPATPAVSYLQRHIDDGRIAGISIALANDYSTVFGLRDVRGYDAPQPSVRFFHFWQLIEPNQLNHGAYEITQIVGPSLPALGVLGARYLVTDPGSKLPSNVLPLVYHGKDAKIFENPFAMGRAIVATQVFAAVGENEELSALAARGFDPGRFAVVRTDELGSSQLEPTGERGTARVVREENSRVTLRATLSQPGVVVLDDAWAPGWSVTIDGRPARALQADMVLRGVVAPAGTHTIVWTYRVPGLRTGAAVSLFGLLAILLWGSWLLRRARRPPKPIALASASSVTTSWLASWPADEGADEPARESE